MGEVPDAGAFVAIVADIPEGGGDEREVKAYLRDGQTVSDWFTGSVVGNDLSYPLLAKHSSRANSPLIPPPELSRIPAAILFPSMRPWLRASLASTT